MKYRMLNFIAYPAKITDLWLEVMLRQTHKFILSFGAGENLLAHII